MEGPNIWTFHISRRFSVTGPSLCAHKLQLGKDTSRPVEATKLPKIGSPMMFFTPLRVPDGRDGLQSVLSTYHV